MGRYFKWIIVLLLGALALAALGYFMVLDDKDACLDAGGAMRMNVCVQE